MTEDLDLLQRWREGDKGAGEALLRTYYRGIFERIRRETGGNAELAADLTQQVFEVVVSKREDIVEHVGRYIHGVARFKLWEYFRRKPGLRTDDAVGDSRLIDPGHGAVSVLEKQQDAQVLVKALQSLSIEEQAYLMWVYADHMTQPAIAKRVGLTASQINGQIHRAREKLRRRIEQLVDSPAQKVAMERGFHTWMASLRIRVEEHGW